MILSKIKNLAFASVAILTFSFTDSKSEIKSLNKDHNSEKIKVGLRLSDKLKQKLTHEKITVSFHIDETGVTKIQEINSNNHEVREHVSEKFKKLTFDNLEKNKNYFVNIIYKII